jgi:hypothetical protein
VVHRNSQATPPLVKVLQPQAGAIWNIQDLKKPIAMLHHSDKYYRGRAMSRHFALRLHTYIQCPYILELSQRAAYGIGSLGRNAASMGNRIATLRHSAVVSSSNSVFSLSYLGYRALLFAQFVKFNKKYVEGEPHVKVVASIRNDS